MKLLTYRRGPTARPAVALDETTGLDLLEADGSLPGRWNELFGRLDRVAELANHWLTGREPDGARSSDGGEETRRHAGGPSGAPGQPPLFRLRSVPLLPPVLQPSKIICVGRNYRDHAEEQKARPPRAPLLFSKAPSCLQGQGGPIVLGPDLDQVDAEAELAVVIGREGRAIRRAEAHLHIAGYTCFNDVSDRKAQFADKQWFRGKSLDTGGPCGPWIVTADELPELASGLAITCRWNGRLMQQSNTGQLIFPVDELIRYASRNMTLLPGDIIATGTPGGVGVFRDPPLFLKPGDQVEVAIEDIGRLTNPVIAG